MCGYAVRTDVDEVSLVWHDAATAKGLFRVMREFGAILLLGRLFALRNDEPVDNRSFAPFHLALVRLANLAIEDETAVTDDANEVWNLDVIVLWILALRGFDAEILANSGTLLLDCERVSLVGF